MFNSRVCKWKLCDFQWMANGISLVEFRHMLCWVRRESKIHIFNDCLCNRA